MLGRLFDCSEALHLVLDFAASLEVDDDVLRAARSEGVVLPLLEDLSKQVHLFAFNDVF